MKAGDKVERQLPTSCVQWVLTPRRYGGVQDSKGPNGDVIERTERWGKFISIERLRPSQRKPPGKGLRF